MNCTRANDPAEDAGRRLDGQRLGEAGDALDEQVSLRQQAHENTLEHRVLAGDHAPDLDQRLLQLLLRLQRCGRRAVGQRRVVARNLFAHVVSSCSLMRDIRKQTKVSFG